jgi:pyruvate-ferredoxin/flavodoxin oxidoreductase
MKEAIAHTYGKKGEKIVALNNDAIDRGINALVKVAIPANWKDAKDNKETVNLEKPEFITQILEPMCAQEGDKLPVSVFKGRENGEFPLGTSAYEKRGIAVNVPEWQMENCIQCNQCSFVCPHAAIRPFLINEQEAKNAPTTFKTKPAIGKGLEGLSFRIQVSTLDCTGCGNCADICPSKVKSLVMKPIHEQMSETKDWEYAATITEKRDKMALNSVKGSQFAKPLFEFSGACAGCGETPYTKLITQLYGDRMMVANATGCSSIWGASAPSMPYCKNEVGKGPAWANSLFEDNAEYGYGMMLGVKQIQNRLKDRMTELITLPIADDLKKPFANWIESMENAEASKIASSEVLKVVGQKTGNSRADVILAEISELKDYLIKKSMWIFGGDGWAYDIGYGGLDHVLAAGEDVNVIVYDTEVYSNTGGQASKSSPRSAVAKFAASGKKTKKKDLGMMAISYGYVYVAQVAMGADKGQYLKALMEAEAYNGPSLIIAYSPCINHGIKAGMGKTQEQQKKAVEAGYWHLYRYNPLLKAEGKNPFQLDSKEPTASFQDFLMGEVRYASLLQLFPDVAKELFVKSEEDSKDRYLSYKKLAGI